MDVFLNIFLAVLAVILLFGIIGDSEAENRRYYANGFLAVIFAIIILNALPLL